MPCQPTTWGGLGTCHTQKKTFPATHVETYSPSSEDYFPFGPRDLRACTFASGRVQLIDLQTSKTSYEKGVSPL